MTTLADRSIAALRSLHDQLADHVALLSDDDLAATSGATDWTVAQVLSHLGSGAEITRAGLEAALAGTPPPDGSFNPGVWDRWNAKTPRAQAEDAVTSDAALVELLEGLEPAQRETLRVRTFLPEPVPLSTVAGLRLHEAAQHAWDLQVARDTSATLDAGSADVLLEHFTGDLGFLLGFLGKADALTGPAVVAVEGSDLAIVVDETVALRREAAEPTARLTARPESLVRLLGGRLRPGRTPGDVAASGAVTLEDLRRVFPGF